MDETYADPSTVAGGRSIIMTAECPRCTRKELHEELKPPTGIEYVRPVCRICREELAGPTILRRFADASQRVVDCWESGNLAEAVNILNGVLYDYRNRK